MKTLLTAGALLVASSTAFAGTYTNMDTFGVQGSANDVAIGTLAETISIAGFDASLGNLTSVSVTVFAQLDSEGTSMNQSGSALGRADVAISLFQDWAVTTSAADDHTFAAADFVNPLLTDSSSAPGTFTLADGQTFAYDVTSGELSATLTSVDTAAFTTGSAVDFLFSGFATTNINNSVDSGTGAFTNSFATGSWGKVEVAYTYDAVVASVPETGSLAIFGLGLAGFALSRKAKKSA